MVSTITKCDSIVILYVFCSLMTWLYSVKIFAFGFECENVYTLRTPEFSRWPLQYWCSLTVVRRKTFKKSSKILYTPTRVNKTETHNHDVYKVLYSKCDMHGPWVSRSGHRTRQIWTYSVVDIRESILSYSNIYSRETKCTFWCP